MTTSMSAIAPTAISTIGTKADPQRRSDLKSRVAAIIGVDVSPAWDIVDEISEEGLSLVHYVDDANMATWGGLRGVIVDTVQGTLVCTSFGYTPSAIAGFLEPAEDGSLTLKDDFGYDYTFKGGNYQLKLGFDGVILRAFKHHGKVYRATHRKINPLRSRWGGSEPFLEIYRRLGGPGDEELFEESLPDSPWVYTFLLVDPALLIGTKQDVGPGYIVLLSVRAMRPVSETPKFNVGSEGVILSQSSQTPSGASIQLTLEEANYHLANGYYERVDTGSDPRLQTGEFIMLQETSPEGLPTGTLLKVQSPSYAWRVGMRDNDPNLRHRFYDLVEGSYLDTRQTAFAESFKERFPLVVVPTVKELRERLDTGPPLVVLPPSDSSQPPTNREDLLKMIWADYFISVPLAQQRGVLDFLTDFWNDRAALIQWIIGIESTGNEEDEKYPDRVRGIITAARKFAVDKNRIQVRDPVSRKLPFPVLIKNNIRNLVNKERGNSLYKLVREMKVIKADEGSKEEK